MARKDIGRKASNPAKVHHVPCHQTRMKQAQTDEIQRDPARTYIQLIGGLMLSNLSHQLPLIMALPETMPIQHLTSLYVEPLVKASQKVATM